MQNEVRKLALNKSLSAIHIKRNICGSCPLHWHDFYELELVNAGGGTQHINGTEYSYRKGDMFLLSCTDFHELTLEDGTDIWLVQIPAGLMPSSVLPLCQLMRRAKLDDTDYRRMDMLLTMLKDAVESGKRTLSDSLLESLLLFFLDCAAVPSDGGNIVTDILLYLQEYFSEPISLTSLSERFNLSKNYMCSVFSKQTGTTIVKYLRSVRMKNAARLVTLTNLTTQEIASESGYGNTASFLRDFKATFRVPPMKMRSEYKEKQ